VELATAIARICSPASVPVNPTIPGVAVVHRAAPSPPRRPAGPQVSPCAGSGRARVSALCPGGWR
jgi:hypothetical protein